MINCVIEYLINGTYDVDIYKATIIYFLGVIGFSFGSICFLLNKKQLPKVKNINLNLPINKFSNFLFTLSLCIVLYKSIFFYMNGVLFNTAAFEEKSRNELYEVNQLLVITGYILIGAFLFVIYNFRHITKNLLFLFSLLLLYYILLQLSVGNRREFTPIILAIFYILINEKKIIFKKYYLIFILFFIFLFNSISAFRDPLLRESTMNEKFAISLISNEFVYPFQTLYLPVKAANHGTNEFIYGKSLFFNTFSIFIPRILFPNKPNSLALDFVLKNFDGGMGYAYMPASEFYINFGLFGPLVCFFIIGYLIRHIIIYKPILTFIFFTMIPDFCRGEISSFIYQLFFFALFFIINYFRLRINFEKHFSYA
jgi:oligosaccharide repeat unit polymerase